MFTFVGSASAAGSITALSTPTVIDNPAVGQALGTIKVTVPGGSIKAGDSVIFKLPSGFDFDAVTGFQFSVPGNNAFDETTDPGTGSRVVVPTTVNAAGDPNGLLAAGITVTELDPNDEIQLTANVAQDIVSDFVFYIYLEDIEVEEGTNEDCVVTFDGPANTGFATGSVVVGSCSSTGEITLTVSGVDTSNNNFTFDLRVKEGTAGALELADETIKIELPDGYVWTTAAADDLVQAALWGDNIWYDINVNDEELTIDLKGTWVDGDADGVYDAGEGTAAVTAEASCWEFAGLAFTVDDESEVEVGEFEAKFSGESTISSDTKIVVGEYGEFGAVIDTEDVPTVFAGLDEQEIADIIIKESLAASLVAGRTITITLPDGVVWQEEYVSDTTGAAIGVLDDFDVDEGLVVNFTNFTGTDNRTAKFTVATASADAAEIKLEDQEIAVRADFEGDVVATVSGSAGVTGEIVLAKVVPTVTAESENVTDVVIGKKGQVAADFTITEQEAGALEEALMTLDLPGDVVFAGVPTVKVIEGDLKIANVATVAGDNQVQFDITNDSSEPSTIKVSGVKLALYRTVPEGAVNIKVQGLAAVETDAYSGWTNADTVASTTIANVVTSAPEEISNKGAFVIGSTTYTLNGVEKTMDVAPYIKGDRTYMPIRYVAYALGIDDNNILWDGVKRTVTLMKGDKVVQLQIGSNTILINGAAVTMDVAPEITSDRTMLPARFVAQAFGATVGWDPATQTVTIE